MNESYFNGYYISHIYIVAVALYFLFAFFYLAFHVYFEEKMSEKDSADLNEYIFIIKRKNEKNNIKSIE